MMSKTTATGRAVTAVVLASATLSAQQKPAPSPTAVGLEFPVIMQQKVGAGQTPVGTKVQAKLAVATLVNGVVVPEDAILSGEVTQSEAKSATTPSRLAICMHSAQWKNGSTSLKVYLTAWYYPVATPNQDLSPGLADAANDPSLRTRGGYPAVRNPASPPFPGSDKGAATLPSPSPASSSISRHPVLMKNVEFTRNSDGAVTLTCKHSNLKLDKQTTYVFGADGPLLPAR